MLSAKNKLPRRLFGPVFKKAKAVFGSHLVLKYFRDYQQKTIRFSVVIPKTVVKRAAQRNRTKRQVYTILQKEIKKIKPPYFGVFLFKKGAELMSFDQIRTEILLLLKKSQIKVD